MSKISVIKRILIVAILTLSATIVACVVSVFAFPSDNLSVEQEEVNTKWIGAYATYEEFSIGALSGAVYWDGCDAGLADIIDGNALYKDIAYFGLVYQYGGDIFKKDGSQMYRFDRIEVKIGTYAQLCAMRNSINEKTEFSTKFINKMPMSSNYITYVLTNDIEIPSYWEPIGKAGSSSSDHSTSFCGTFDGNGYTITMTEYGPQYWEKSDTICTTDNYVRCGLFSRVHGATIKNLYLQINDSEVTTKNEDGGSGFYDVTSYYGGMIGYATNTTISHCYVKFMYSFELKDTGSRYLYFGGIAGRADNCTISNTSCNIHDTTLNLQYAYAETLERNVYVGGFVGYVEGELEVENSVLTEGLKKVQQNGYSSVVVYAGLLCANKKSGSTITQTKAGGYWMDYVSVYKGNTEQRTVTQSNSLNNYTFDDWTYLSNLNSTVQIGSNKNYWYLMDDGPVQGWFAKISVQVHNLMSSGSYHPEGTKTITEIRLGKNITWNGFYRAINFNHDNFAGCLDSDPTKGYTFKGFATSNLGNKKDNVSKTSCYRPQGSSEFKDITLYSSTNVITNLGPYDSTNKCYNIYAVWELTKYEIWVSTYNLAEVSEIYNSEQRFIHAIGYGNTTNGYIHMANDANNNVVDDLKKSNIEKQALAYHLDSDVTLKEIYKVEFVDSAGKALSYPSDITSGCYRGLSVCVKYVVKDDVKKAAEFKIHSPDGVNSKTIEVYLYNGSYICTPNYGELLTLGTLTNVLATWYGDEYYRVLGFTVDNYLQMANGDMLAKNVIPKRFKFAYNKLCAVYIDNTETEISNISILNNLKNEIKYYGEDQSYLTLRTEIKNTISASGTDKTWEAYTSLTIDAPDAGFMTPPTINIYPIIINDTYMIYYRNDGEQSEEEYNIQQGKTVKSNEENMLGWVLWEDKYSDDSYTIKINTSDIRITSDAVNIILRTEKDAKTGRIFVKEVAKESYGDVYLDAFLKGHIIFDWENGEIVG